MWRLLQQNETFVAVVHDGLVICNFLLLTHDALIFSEICGGNVLTAACIGHVSRSYDARITNPWFLSISLRMSTLGAKLLDPAVGPPS